MIEKTPMTLKGFQALEAELKQRKTIDRPAIVTAIAEAREHGDLKENAEYHAAKEQQGFNESRIKTLEHCIGMAEVINPADVSCDKIRFSASIKVEDDDTKEVQHYQIVGHEESDINSGLLSYKSPLARALINKKVGDFIEFETPKSSKAYTILEINYI